MTKKQKTQIIATLVLCMATFFSLPALAGNPGSADDPMITMSYINDIVIPQMKGYVDSQIKNVQQNNSQSPEIPQLATGTTFNVVNVSKGQTIYGGKSSQMILRMGKGTIVSSPKGGVADVTDGVDLTTGTPVPSNHLLIIPIDDMRGIKMESDGIIMICGAYSVKN